MIKREKFCVVCARVIDPTQATGGSQLCGDLGCERTFRSHLIARRPSCAVCGRISLVLRRLFGKVSVCERSECQRTAIELRDHDAGFCRVCGLHLERHSAHRLHGLCESHFCRQWDAREASHENDRLRSMKIERRRTELVRLVGETLPKLPSNFNSSRSSEVIVLPYLANQVERPTADRLHQVEAGLLAMATEARVTLDAFDVPSSIHCDESDGEDRLAHFSKVACGTCGGRCCRNGRDDGFLNSQKFREVLGSRPGIKPEELVVEYVARIPDRTIMGSCIFHGVKGCVLTRAQRSLTCNSYICTGMKTLQNCVETGASEVVFAATNIRDGADREPVVFRITIARASSRDDEWEFGGDSHDL